MEKFSECGDDLVGQGFESGLTFFDVAASCSGAKLLKIEIESAEADCRDMSKTNTVVR